MLKSRLVIVGAGDFAREVLWACGELRSDQRAWTTVCFVDDHVEAARKRMQNSGVEWPVIGTIRDFRPNSNDLLVCAIGSPRAKIEICGSLREKGGKFVNVLHPTAAIGPGTTIGAGVIMMRSCVVTVGVRIGDFVTINAHSGCGHDAIIEDGCTLSAYCDITGHAHLDKGVFLGSHAAVMPGVRVGEFAVIAAGSVAFRNVKSSVTVIGVPAKALI